MSEQDCIFCKIIKGEIPSTVLYEDEDSKVIFDIAPAAEGHVIIISKHHAANIYEMPDELVSKLFLTAKKVATVLKKVLNCDGINIVQNNGEAAGQTVYHLHIHVIPRFIDDGVHLLWEQGKIDSEEIKKITEEATKFF